MAKSAAQQRLDDPDGHYPYKLDEALALDLDAPAGPNGPDDRSRVVGDFITYDVAEAAAAHVEAQGEYVKNPGDGTRAEYEATRDALVAARRQHRAGRPGSAPTVEG